MPYLSVTRNGESTKNRCFLSDKKTQIGKECSKPFRAMFGFFRKFLPDFHFS